MRAWGMAALLGMYAAGMAAGDETPPNVVLIVADDLGWNDVGCHGGEIATPHLDALARTGVQLNRHYVYPSCSPTRACLLSGRNASRFRIPGPIGMGRNAPHLPHEVETLAERLKARGYATALVGKWHLGNSNLTGPRTQGFDEFYGYLHGQVDQFRHVSWDEEPIWLRNETPIDEPGHATDLFAREAVEFIRRKAGGPFFLDLSFSVPHYPLQAEARWLERYAHIADPDRRTYAAMVAQMDDAIGKVVAVLDELKLRERTLILFTSDNGGQKDWLATRYGGRHGPYKTLGDNRPLRGWKTELAEGGVRVAALANWPGTLEPRIVESVTHACDFYPTVCALAGEPAPADLRLDGVDLGPVLRGEASPPRRFHWNIGSRAGILEGDLKLIVGRRNDAAVELFDLKQDPFEKTNLAGTAPAEVDRLKKLLDEELARDAAEPSPAPLTNPRPPKDEADLRRWLENMVVFHRYSVDEIEDATGLKPAEIEQAVQQFGLRAAAKPARGAEDPLLVLPYPGGRHPRLGFLHGAFRPQRETKASIFTPWDPESYVVADVPEALWSQLGLTYLAHTHIPTVFDKEGKRIEPLEWEVGADGRLFHERKLPNGIVFSSEVAPHRDHVAMKMTLTNGTEETLTDLRVQMCVMLHRARGFEPQSNDNKVLDPPYAAARNADGTRWVITAWDPIHRAWANPPCPCLHADPKFPDCPPGETRTVRGRLSFYEGTDISGELRRIEATGWRR